MQNKLNISLIIPCFNEETNIQKGVLDKIANFTKVRSEFIEVLIVDDGSVDRSTEIIQRDYVNRFPKFKLIKNPHQGKAYTVIKGIQEAKGDYVLFTDIDLATPIEESSKLIAEIQNGFTIVVGSRDTHRQGAPLLRKIMAVGFIYIRNFFIGLKDIKDTQCGFKVFQKKIALNIINHLHVFNKKKTIKGSSVSAGFDLEFLFLAAKSKAKIKEIPVTWKHVETKNVNFIKDAIETIKDILLIKYYDITQKYHL